jgi:PAS domain S-box-containing protein
MGKRSDAETAKELREKIIGFGERSGRKSFYPELRDRLATLERFRALLDQTNDAILVVDGVVSDANQAACRVLDCTAEQLIGMPVRELSAEIADWIEEARPGQLIASLRTRAGREVPVEATVAFRGTGTARVGVVVARDISERQRSERALKESEERFRAVFEGAAIGIAVIDLGGQLQSTNRALRELLGQPDEELRGQSFLSVIHPEDRGRLAEHHDALLRGSGVSATLEVRLARRDGRVVWAHLSASMAIGDDGSPAFLVVAIQDVTPRRRAEEALQFLSRASVRLASSLDVGGTLKNVTDLAVPFLADLCAIWSYTSDAGREHRLVACRDPEQKALVEEFLAGRSIAGVLGAEATGELPRLFPDASGPLVAAAVDDPSRLESLRRLDIRSSIVIPLTASGRRLGTVLLATASSSRRYGAFDLDLATEFGYRAALALENASLFRETQEASRLKDEFLAIVSHELRTPLTAILGWMGILRARRLDQGRTDSALAVVERSARALAQIIDDLLGVSRIMAGKFDIEPAPTDLSPVVESAINSLQPSAADKRVALHVECEPGMPPMMGDARRLQQVVWNLVSNAVKYTPEGGQVRVRLERAGAAAKLTVSDTGCGISREFLPHAFDLFRQADSSSTRQHGGLGLGLTLVQHLVKLHGGTVWAASDGKGRGACFSVTLPLASGEVTTGRARPEPELPLVPDMRILVVEDDPDTLEMLGEILERQGAHVVLASSVSIALRELDLAAPDLLISDIAMPGQDGVALIEAIRQRGLHIPALALSALSREEDRARAQAAGFDRYLLKPVDVRELLQAIASRNVRASAGPPQ